MQDLGTIMNLPQSYATGINDAGQVVGYSFITNVSYNAFLWQADTGMQNIASFIGLEHSTAYAINNSGQVVGGNFGGAYVWKSNTVRQNLSFLPNGAGALALGINNSGQIVGQADGNTAAHAVLWQNTTTVVDLGTLGGTFSSALDVNNSGQVVGYSTFGSSGSAHGFLWQAGTGIKDLNDLIDPSPGWTFDTANAINDPGWIVGWSHNSKGQQHALLLTPVPEPSTWTLLNIGAVAASIMRRKVNSGRRPQRRFRL